MAKLLLDTNILIDAILFPNRLSEKAIIALTDRKNNVVISTASLLEISIKHAKHPNLLPIDSVFLANIIKDNDFDIIPIKENILMLVDDLMSKKIHHDPFDHIILATAISEIFTLVTKDELLSKYNAGDVLIV